MTTDSRELPTDGSGSAGDRPDLPENHTDRDHADTAAPVTEEPPPAPLAKTEPVTSVGLFEENAVHRFQDRWRELQAGFVDDPSQAVHGAAELIDEIMRELAERRQDIEGRWRTGAADTERLRVAIKEYRTFFNQLLNA